MISWCFLTVPEIQLPGELFYHPNLLWQVRCPKCCCWQLMLCPNLVQEHTRCFAQQVLVQNLWAVVQAMQVLEQ
jgi:hypothetical protein